SRLLLLNREKEQIAHKHFDSLPELLREGDLLVRNETRVLPARLLGKKQSGGQVEALLIRQVDPLQNIWRCLTRSSKPVRVGALLEFPEEICGEVVAAEEDGQRLIRFNCPGEFFAVLERAGHMPLPPYIRREDHDFDKDRYQTVFANNPGAVAAPTAGLHFTEETFAALADRNIDVCGITLHVGPGTFLPVRTENLREHRMHSEVYEIPQSTAEQINAARADGRRIVALGTTVTRTLEHAVDGQGLLQAGQGETDLFILPGFRFRMVDALITNFHLPKSTLLVLVSAFAGRDFILQAYREAVDHSYRFFSYGDCMLIE
ncbi:MAG: tRNA preQ1(34) S-adenosylmethionine ribosyltransferase-isomerase QueA, partial [Desulfuromonadales bacterium]|nr:tRNA preQ1(34) S-adenosylmethionine ribosyltransferase-isomerase QueA [Desulfuromonadales bacterium]